MKLELGGITTEVTNPSDIAIMKRRGWVEVKQSKPEKETTKKAAGEKTAGDDNKAVGK